MVHPEDLQANILPAIFLTTLSGLSTGIGGLLIVLWGNPSMAALGHMLSFSAGVMIYISFLDLLPDAIKEIGFLHANIWFFLGILFFAAVTYFIPEPEGDHEAKSKAKDPNGKPDSVDLYKAGLVTAIGISLHNFPEGIAVYLACLRGIDVGLPLAFAIAAHNIPEGMAVAAPIYGSTRSKWQAFKWATLSGACEPIGAIIVGGIFSNYLTPFMVQCSLAAVAGIMVKISVQELIPTSLKYISHDSMIVSNVLGMATIFTSVYYLNTVLK